MAKATVISVVSDIVAVERAALQTIEAVLQTLLRAILRGPADDEELLSPRQRAQIRMSVWRLQNVFEVVLHPTDPAALHTALTSLSFLAQQFGSQIIAWVEVIDVLVDEAERHFGTIAGRGLYKRQQVRAAVLTIARRDGIDLPFVPGFLEPLVFSLAADVISDFVVALIDGNELWDETLPTRPGTWRAQLGGPLFYRLDTIFTAVGGFLTGIAWRIAMATVRMSPAMKAAVDRVRPDISGTIAALSTLARFAATHPDYVRAVVEVLSIATQEAETFFELTGPQKQAYAQAMIMAFLEQNGFVEPSGLWREIVKAGVNLTIDATVAIFNRRQLFTPRRRARTPANVQ